MLPGKLKRLVHEHHEMQSLRQQTSLLTFATKGSPPTTYGVALSCVGLQRIGDAVTLAEHHEFLIVLENDFPLVSPTIVWKTPIFHPNIKAPHVCLGDHWYAGWNLAAMCIALCEMVQYKSFNIYDPLDVEAALWLDFALKEDGSRFPIDRRPVLDLAFTVCSAERRNPGGEPPPKDPIAP
jgi:ubiquitin-protein ligase